MALTNLQCKNAKPKEKPYKLAAGRGLYLHVMINGRRYWRMKYRFGGKEKLLALGVYPELSLKEAEEKCMEARKLLEQNIDPLKAKKNDKNDAEERASNTFEATAKEWHENFKHKWTKRHADTVIRRLERDIFPEIGYMPITEIKPRDIIKALKKVQSRGAYEPAHRLRQYCKQIFAYAIINEKAEINPASDIGMVLKPVVKKHYACIEVKEIPELLDAISRNDARLHVDLPRIVVPVPELVTGLVSMR